MSMKVNVRPVKGHKVYNYRVTYPDGNKRRSKGFKMRKDAESWAKDKRDEIVATGTAEGAITREERRAVMMFRDAVASMHDHQGTLTDAVSLYLEHVSLNERAMTCREVADRHVDRLHTEKKSKRHINTTKSLTGRFNAEYGDRMASDITTEIVDDFLTHLNRSATTMKNYKTAISGMFSHAVRLKAATHNPASDALRIKRIKKEPGILTVQQLVAMLGASTDRYLPALAISFFTGIRASEIEQLDWRQIDFDEGYIEIKAPVAKKDRRRFVPITDNLRAWILPHRKKQGLVIQSPQIHRTERERAMKIAGINPWPSNAGRDSYASYHLAEFNDVGATAFNMGKKNPSDVYEDYRALVKPKDAHTYWSIVPEKAPNITDIKAS
jgi:integrase